MLLSRLPLPLRGARLACVRPAASVRSEPGSNSQVGENFFPASHNVLTRSTTLTARATCSCNQGVDLKRRPPKSRPTAPLGKLLFREEAARKDSAVHVSLSSYSLVKQPGNRSSPHPRCAGGSSKRPASDHNRKPSLPLIVRIFGGAPSRRNAVGAPYVRYIGFGALQCQHKGHKILFLRRNIADRKTRSYVSCLEQVDTCAQHRHAALRPHFSAVLAPSGRRCWFGGIHAKVIIGDDRRYYPT